MTDFFVNNVNTFSKIASENLERSLLFREKARRTKLASEHVTFIMQSREYAIVAIIFSALTLESYINEYAARKKGVTYFNKHLEKIDFLNKWIVIPELCTGKSFPKNKQCYENLDKLKTMRNNLVHSKPKPIQINNHEAFNKLGKEVYEIIRNAELAIKTISMVINCLTEIDPDEKQYLSNGSKS